MAGIDGFSHSCSSEKHSKQIHQNSVHQSQFTKEEISIIWDFYVTRSFAASSGQALSLEDYGWHATQSKSGGYPAIEAQLAAAANINSFAIIRAKTLHDTLAAMGLKNDLICVVHPRAVIKQNFSYKHDENEKVSVVSEESRVHSIFRHIRNSLAHGLTCFFDNGYMLLEDKESQTKISASILIAQTTLLDWISVIDKDGKYYPKAD
ncbi:MAG: hypothetical protein GX777_07055 [Fastidiosipila sp.]|nr:hypothetical protein [Fastidiosipila sp.]